MKIGYRALVLRAQALVDQESFLFEFSGIGTCKDWGSRWHTGLIPTDPLRFVFAD
jgi:hypothetical protein